MTYLEFFDNVVLGNSDLTKRVEVAAVAWALTVSALPDEDPTKAGKQKWATEIFTKPESSAIKMLWFAVGNNGITGDGSQIDDATLQTRVNNLSNNQYANAVLMPDIKSIVRTQVL